MSTSDRTATSAAASRHTADRSPAGRTHPAVPDVIATMSGFARAQCGYCTPGMIMAARDLLRRNPHPSEAEIREGLEGNLCRCTGYQNIVSAVQAVADAQSAQAGAMS